MDNSSEGEAASTAKKPGPLTGLRVFDMTQVAAGPWVGVLLGWLGATVIRIEPPGGDWSGDMSARILPTMNGLGTTWLTCNMFKQSVSLNFKDPGDRELGYKLLAGCDLFVENMRKGVADRLGFGYETLQALNPSLCYVSINGYGQVGPMSDQGATDPLIQAYSGWAALNGSEGGRGELHRSYAHLDLTSGTYATYGAMLLLLRRRLTGIGGRINIAMLRAALGNQTTRLAEYFATTQQPAPSSSAASRTAPNQAFRCQDNRYLAVSVETEPQWAKLCLALQSPELEARYPTNETRVAGRIALGEELAGVFRTRPTRWWQLRLSQAGVPNSLFLSFDELLNHPQVQANDLIVRDETAFGPLWVGGAPIRFAGHETPAPRSITPNADTEAVLATIREHQPVDVAGSGS